MTKFSLKKSLFNDRFVLILSLILSILLWLVISISVSPTVTKDISNIPVTISLENSSFEGLKVFGSEDHNVQVKIQGKKYVTDSVTASDISVTANIGQIVGTGVSTLELSARSVGSNDFEILSVEPSTVVVYLDYPDEKTVNVDIEYKGATVGKDNYFLEANVSDAYKTVTVSGAKSEVQSVARAVAVADVNSELNATTDFETGLQLFDASGNPVSLEYSTLSFNTVNITVSVQEQTTLPLTITPVNAPDTLPDIKIYRILNNTQSEVSEIVVKGEPPVVETLKEFSIGTVDFSKLDKNKNSWTFDFNLPSIGGLSYPTISSPSEAQFRVVISTRQIYSKTFDIDQKSIKIKGLDNAHTVSVETKSLQGVTVVSTSLAQLNRLKNSDIIAYVDVSSLEAGSHSCNKITFEITGNPNCWVVIPEGDSFDVALKIE